MAKPASAAKIKSPAPTSIQQWVRDMAKIESSLGQTRTVATWQRYIKAAQAIPQSARKAKPMADLLAKLKKVETHLKANPGAKSIKVGCTAAFRSSLKAYIASQNKQAKPSTASTTPKPSTAKVKPKKKPVARKKRSTPTQKRAAEVIDMATATPARPASTGAMNGPAPEFVSAATEGLAPGFVSATEIDTIKTPPRKETKGGEIGKFIGPQQMIGKAIVVYGPSHTGKSEICAQICNAFLETYPSAMAAWNDVESMGIVNADTQDMINRNFSQKNKGRLQVGNIETYEDVLALAEKYQIIVIDSFNELMIGHREASGRDFNKLRRDYPHVLWIVMFQMLDDHEVRGGKKSIYAAPVVIETSLADTKYCSGQHHDRMLATIKKNRGNSALIEAQYWTTPKRMATKADFDAPEEDSDE